LSWPGEAFEALKKIILVDHRVTSLSDQVKELAATCQDLNSRLIRLEAKFELIERMATPARRALPEKSHE
jgi:hypothetical protein